MGPISCAETSVKDYPLDAALYPRRVQISSPSGRKPEIMGLGQVLPPLFRFSPLRIIPPMLHIHFLVSTPLIRTSGRRLRTFEESNALSDIQEHWIQKCFHLVLLGFRASVCVNLLKPSGNFMYHQV
jgi:hypothetical protein